MKDSLRATSAVKTTGKDPDDSVDTKGDYKDKRSIDVEFATEVKGPLYKGMTKLPDTITNKGEATGSIGSSGLGCLEPACVTHGVDKVDIGIPKAKGKEAKTNILSDVTKSGTVHSLEDRKVEGTTVDSLARENTTTVS